MGKVVILTEDTTGGKIFYQLLIDNGIFINTDVFDTEKGTNWNGGGYDFQPALKYLIDNKILNSGDTLILAIDKQIAMSEQMIHDNALRNNRAVNSAKLLKSANINCHITTFLCWEDLILSCVELLDICGFGQPYEDDIEQTFMALHDNIYRRRDLELTENLAQLYVKLTKRYRSKERKTVEKAISYIVERITNRESLGQFKIKKMDSEAAGVRIAQIIC